MGFVIAPNFSAIFPTTLALIGDRYQRFSASVFSFIFTVALIGGMAFPPLVGRLAATYGLRAAMAVPLAGITIVIALAISLRARQYRRGETGKKLPSELGAPISK